MAHALGFVIISFFYIKFYTFFPKYLVSSFFCCTFAANIPIMEYGLGCPRLEGLSVLAVLFLFVRYNFYAYLFQVFCINVIPYYVVCHIEFICHRVLLHHKG